MFAVHPDLDDNELHRGNEVVLNESLNVVLSRNAEFAGEGSPPSKRCSTMTTLPRSLRQACAPAGVRLGRAGGGGLVGAPLPRYVREPFGPGWALVGDAGYHRDPITGHGITDAFRDAELLADALDFALRVPPEEREALPTFQTSRDIASPRPPPHPELTDLPRPSALRRAQIELSDGPRARGGRPPPPARTPGHTPSARLTTTHPRGGTTMPTENLPAPQRRRHATLFATLDAVRASPSGRGFQFRATTSGSAAPTTAAHSGYHGAGQEHEHQRAVTVNADHPAVLVGEDHDPTPAECLLHAWAAA